MKKKRLAVVGVGSAGILSLTHFCTWLDNSWEVVSIHDPKKKILGIGESTNGGFVALLERGTHFSLGHQEDIDKLDATLKFGSYFVNWRKEPWLNPLLDGNVAIHFNNFNFKEFVHKRLKKIWPKQFRVLEGEVTAMDNLPDKVVAVVDGKPYYFDYLIDCTGFPKDFTGYTMSDCTPVSRCLIQDVYDYEFQPYTDHIATKHGWMFGVPLKSRKTYGYLYNDDITPKEEAIEDMKEILGVDEFMDKEYVFKCYYANQMIEGRICKNGNRALFFEPLVANSIFLYIYAMQLFYDYIINGVSQEASNAAFINAVQQMEDVISYYYSCGSTFKTKFWKDAQKRMKKRIKNRPMFHEMMNTYRNLKANGTLYAGPTYGFAPRTWELMEAHFGTKYIG